MENAVELDVPLKVDVTVGKVAKINIIHMYIY